MQVEMKWQKPCREGTCYVQWFDDRVCRLVERDGEWFYRYQRCRMPIGDALVCYIPGPPPEEEQGPTPDELLAEAVRLLDAATKYRPCSAFDESCTYCSREPHYDHMDDCPVTLARDFVRRYRESHNGQ